MHNTNHPILSLSYVGRDSSVAIATRYRLDDPGIESRYRRYFPHLSRPVLGPTQPPIQLYLASFPVVKRSGRGVDHPSPSSTEVKEKVIFIGFPRQQWLGERTSGNGSALCLHN